MPNDLNNIFLNNAFLATTDHKTVARRGAKNSASTTAKTAMTWTISGLALAACQEFPILLLTGGSRSSSINVSNGTAIVGHPAETTEINFSFANAAPAGSGGSGVTVEAQAMGGPVPLPIPTAPATIPTDAMDIPRPAGSAPSTTRQVDGEYGTFTVTRNADGTFVANYMATNAGDNQKYGPRDTFYEQLVIYSDDDTTAPGTNVERVFNVRVIGFANDAPTVTATGTATVAENIAGAVLSGITITNVTDAEVSDRDNLTLRVVSGETGQGALTDDEANRLFQVVESGSGYALKLRDGQSLDYETKDSYSLRIEVNDGNRENNTGESGTITVNVNNVDETDATVTIARTEGSGDYAAGDVITASVTEDADDPSATIAYQWSLNGVDISGETGSTYRLKDTDITGRLAVEITYTDPGNDTNTTETKNSNEITLDGAPSNNPPTIISPTIPISDLETHAFSTASFGFNDVDQGDALASVTITSLPSQGSLTLDGNTITVPRTINAADVGNLVFTPDISNSDYNAIIRYTVSDGTDNSDPGMLTISVTAIAETIFGPDTNDVPLADYSASVQETNNLLKFSTLRTSLQEIFDDVDNSQELKTFLQDNNVSIKSATVIDDHNATIVISVGGNDVNINYTLSGTFSSIDLSFVKLVQDGDDVRVVSTAPLDFENPLDHRMDNSYFITETFSTTDTSIPEASRSFTTTYSLTVTNDTSDDVGGILNMDEHALVENYDSDYGFDDSSYDIQNSAQDFA